MLPLCQLPPEIQRTLNRFRQMHGKIGQTTRSVLYCSPRTLLQPLSGNADNQADAVKSP
jgi:hypothetical protein